METLNSVQEYLPQNPKLGFVFNPASTDAKRAEQKLGAYQQTESFIPESVYVTKLGGLEANREGLQKLLLDGAGKDDDGNVIPYDAIVNLGGDGMGDMVANFMAGDPALTPALRLTPIVEAGNGGVNDGHLTDFNPGDLDLTKLGGLPLVPRYPIRIETTPPDGETSVRYTSRYVSLGFTALAAEGINRPNSRQSWLRRTRLGRKALEVMVVAGALVKSSNFKLTEDGQERPVHELIISNNSRMAGFELFPGDGRQDTLHVLEAKNKLALLLKMGRLLVGRQQWQTRKQLDVIVQATGKGKQTTIPSQHNGEEQRLVPGTRLVATKEKTPLWYVATRLLAA
jgi:hypothetical protein